MSYQAPLFFRKLQYTAHSPLSHAHSLTHSLRQAPLAPARDPRSIVQGARGQSRVGQVSPRPCRAVPKCAPNRQSLVPAGRRRWCLRRFVICRATDPSARIVRKTCDISVAAARQPARGCSRVAGNVGVERFGLRYAIVGPRVAV